MLQKRKKYKDPVVYKKVADSLFGLSSATLASMRVFIVKPSFIDSIRIKLKKHPGITVEHKDGWLYCFLYGEEELQELLRQLT